MQDVEKAKVKRQKGHTHHAQHERRATSDESFLAVIDDTGDFAAEVFAVDNLIDKAVL
jgi:hypothetical protein